MSDEITKLQDEIERAASAKAWNEVHSIFANVPYAGGVLELKTTKGDRVFVSEQEIFQALKNAMADRHKIRHMRRMIADIVERAS